MPIGVVWSDACMHGLFVLILICAAVLVMILKLSSYIDWVNLLLWCILAQILTSPVILFAFCYLEYLDATF